MALKNYDVIVIGSGSAGFSAAFAARERGVSVLLIEKDKLGGECPNLACVPSKALLKCAKTYQKVKHAGQYGVEVGGVAFNFEKMMAYREKIVRKITGGGEHGDRYLELAEENSIEIEIGTAQMQSDTIVEVNGQMFVGKAFVIATGTVDFIPSISGIEKIRPMNFRQALTLKKQPRKLAIIGGGPVGSELATFYAMLGTRVVLFQSSPTILNREDPEIAELAHGFIHKNGVGAFGNSKVIEVKDASGGVYGLTVEINGKKETQAVDQILIAAGKRSATEGLGLEDTGVNLDQQGIIKTNTEQRTNIKHIFAAGDVDGGMMFTHTAHAEGDVAGYNAALVAEKKRQGFKKIDMRVVPRVTFVVPEVASVGLTGPEARIKFKKVLVGRFETGKLGRSITEGSENGLVKIIAHPKTRKIVGGHAVCDRAGEIIHEVALAIHLGATIDKVASMIHAYPTFSEAIASAASSAKIE